MAKSVTKLDWLTGSGKPQNENFLRLLEQPAGVEPLPEARADLLATIHEKIIPQLLLAHYEQLPEEEPCPDARKPPTDEEILEFSRLAVAQDVNAALAFVETLATGGISLETVLLQLIAPAARRLGTDWEEDLRSFTEVTIGLATLQKIVQILGPSFASDTFNHGLVVLISPQSEQHTLGVYLLGEFLRRAGWGVQVAPSMSESELVGLVQSERVEMVGISVSNTDLLGPLKHLVSVIKKASLNPDVVVMVGGTYELVHHASALGAAFCADPHDAVRWLEQNIRSRGAGLS